jgi:hypothetical protein
MEERHSGWSNLAQWLSLVTIGLGIGWLTGLSATPVLSVVLTAILGAAAGLVAGTKVAPLLRRIDARPLATIVLALALSAPLGILARSYRLFGPVTLARAPMTTPTAAQAAAKTEPAPDFPALFTAAGGAECERLVGSPDRFLRSALQTSSFEWAPSLEAEVRDDAKLRRLVSQLCSRK